MVFYDSALTIWRSYQLIFWFQDTWTTWKRKGTNLSRRTASFQRPKATCQTWPRAATTTATASSRASQRMTQQKWSASRRCPTPRPWLFKMGLAARWGATVPAKACLTWLQCPQDQSLQPACLQVVCQCLLFLWINHTESNNFPACLYFARSFKLVFPNLLGSTY